MLKKTCLHKYSILFTLYLVVFLNSIGYFLILPAIAKLLSASQHGLISDEFIQAFGPYVFSIILATGSLAAIVFAPLLGRLSDIMGRKKTLLLCTSLMIASLILPIVGLVSSNIFIFMLGNAINGIASNDQPIAQAAISDISHQQQNKAMRFSIDTFVICLAMSVGPLAGTLLSDSHRVSWFNNTTPFWVATGLSVFALLLIIFLLPETNHHLLKDKSITLKRGLRSFTDFFRLPASLLRLLFVFFCAQTAWAQFFQYLYVYLGPVRHFTDAEVGWYTGLTGLYFSIALLVIYPFLLRWKTFRSSISLCLFVAMISMFVMSLFHADWILWIFVIPLTWGMGMYFPSLLTLFSQLVQETEQGWIMAIATALIGIAWLVTGFGAICLEQINPNLPFVISVVLLAIAWLVMQYDCRKHVKKMSAK